jgi:hypothetical protein
MKVLCVHGVWTDEDDPSTFDDKWQEAVQEALGDEAKPIFCRYNDLFEADPLTWGETWAAFEQLTGNAWNSWWRPTRSTVGSDPVGWTAGMVAHWAGSPELREACRKRVQARIDEEKPDIILAHSLGSLICYDLFTRQPDIVLGRVFVSFGSQINSSFVRGTFKKEDDGEGGVYPLPAGALWVHLFNPNDQMFTSDFGEDMLGTNNFIQRHPTFNGGLLGSHTDIVAYLNKSDADEAWPMVKDWLAARAVGPKGLAGPALKPAPVVPALAVKREPRPKRALLVGINRYASAKAPPLSGCVNDVFQVSATLQENGFAAEDIRVVLDERATADGIRERLVWLFDKVREGDTRLFYFSGHGVLLPVYDARGKPDRLLDALVPHDFDGSVPRAITDRDLAPLYEKLPFSAKLILAFDCCRSVVQTRPDAGQRSPGLDLPDDVRHRMLQWNEKEQMWQLRDFPPLLPTDEAASPAWRRDYSGVRNDTERIGRSVVRRALPDKDFDALCTTTGWKGPYLPMIFEACGEQQEAEEYLHGQVAYGAFTYAFCQALRQARERGQSLTWQELVELVRDRLHRLSYRQTPEVLGPDGWRNAHVPIVGPRR